MVINLTINIGVKKLGQAVLFVVSIVLEYGMKQFSAFGDEDVEV
ncbi:hypothetical protein [Vulcanibacillus modesticaldus]|nr:hypothetical protein [Vulcanibacillus modesticaldus]